MLGFAGVALFVLWLGYVVWGLFEKPRAEEKEPESGLKEAHTGWTLLIFAIVILLMAYGVFFPRHHY